MFKRPLIALFLALSLTVATMGSVPAAQDSPPNEAEEARLTPDEERDARVLVEEFISRLEESEDVTPLVKELFVDDFTERFRADLDDNFPLAASPEVAALMSSDEILRAYAASINCTYMSMLLFMEVFRKRAQENEKLSGSEDSEKKRELTIEEIIPPSVIKLIQSDPVLAVILARELKKEKEELKSEREPAEVEVAPRAGTAGYQDSQGDSSIEDLIPFKSLEQMRHYTSMAERGVALLREHLKVVSLEPRPSVRRTWLQLVKEKSEVNDQDEAINPRLDIQTDKYMGYSAGTRVIAAYVLMFRIEIVRTSDGHLKILRVYWVMD